MLVFFIHYLKQTKSQDECIINCHNNRHKQLSIKAIQHTKSELRCSRTSRHASTEASEYPNHPQLSEHTLSSMYKDKSQRARNKLKGNKKNSLEFGNELKQG